MEATQKYLYSKLMIACHSSAVEGSQVTFEQTRNLIEHNSADQVSFSDALMVKDHYDALEYVLKLASSQIPLSIEHIKTINQKVMKNTGEVGNNIFGDYDSSSGAFRKVAVHAGTRSFMTPNKIPEAMNDLIDSFQDFYLLKSEKAIRYRAWQSHYNLVTIHPFLDGNGRTSRLLMNYLEAYHQLDLTVVLGSLKNQYIAALEKTRKTEDLKPLYSFMEESFRQANELIKDEMLKNTITKTKGKGQGFMVF